ncbi:MAG: hypothetical protein IPP15_19090 [Saprospiraceae bacterium]|uniref:OmpA-like domain-containing protein n=1 Tax=Candidatus Opimibacter skivensis TaxID=2982028 RepID=A0A9D7SYS8_9BACT|nr:hypothetical protein [Candidatus Opimibacter skivensis]
MQKKYIAYLALLAGWIVFCYWLYAKELFPRFHGMKETTGIQLIKGLKYPLAFNWASDMPLAGEGYNDWLKDMEQSDSTTGTMIITGFYFRDEQGSIPLDEALAHQRVNNVLKLVKVPLDRIMIQVLPQEINADVRSNPFEAISMERIALSNLLQIAGDTIEMCFPIKDSLILPPLVLNRLDAWLDQHADRKDSLTYIVGIADGGGIAESADIALDRAIVVERVLVAKGWKAEQIHLSTGQRSSPHAIRNRCVIIYFE